MDGLDVTGDADDGEADGPSVGASVFPIGVAEDGEWDGDGLFTGTELGVGVSGEPLPNPTGTAQLGDTGCVHCLYGLLLHTAPGSQQTESSVQACA